MDRQKIRSKSKNSKYIMKPKVMRRSFKLTMTNMSDWKLLAIAYCDCFSACNWLLMKTQLGQIRSDMIWAACVSEPAIAVLHLRWVSHHWSQLSRGMPPNSLLMSVFSIKLYMVSSRLLGPGLRDSLLISFTLASRLQGLMVISSSTVMMASWCSFCCM